jgi:hypothetical protein
VVSCSDSEPVLPPVLSAEARNSLVVRHQWAGKLDCGGNHQTARWITVCQMVEVVATRRRMMAQRRWHNAGTIEEALNPSVDGNIQVNPSGVDEQRHFPRADGAQVNAPAAAPALVDQSAGRRTQVIVAAVEP